MFHSLAAAIHSDPTEARNKTLRNELLHEFYSFRPNGTGSGPDAEDLMRQYYACGAIVNDVNLLYILCGVKRAGFLDRGVGFIWNMAVDGPLGMYVSLPPKQTDRVFLESISACRCVFSACRCVFSACLCVCL